MKQSAVAAVLALLAATGLARAQSEAPPNAFLAQRLNGGATLERYLQMWRSEFARLDADRDGKIDATDIEIHSAMAGSMLRTGLAMQIMGADLDGDGSVSADELRRKLRYDRRNHANQNPQVLAAAEKQAEAQIENLIQADADKDGKVTWNEAIEHAKKQPSYARTIESGLAPMIKQLLAVAPDGKPAIVLSELEAAAAALFRSVDTDNNGTISTDELEAARKVVNRINAEATHRRNMETVRVHCTMPKASDSAKVVLLSAYQAEALSSVTIGSQDVAVGVGTITVEAGAQPIYLVVSSFRPTIWRFYGATERIERLVATANMTGPSRSMPQEKPLVGATGIPAERVTFLGQSRCVAYFNEAPSSKAAIATGLIKRELGKEAAVTAARYALSEVLVPSGRIQSAQESNRGKLVIVKEAGTLEIEGDSSGVIVQTERSSLESEFKRFTPGGVVELDPQRVVASLPAERYEVLPQQAGLLQLVRSGALAQNRSGEFVIKEKIRFPAELTGAHSMKFLLLRGAPLPDGDPGHSEVISEETGERIKFERPR